MLMHHVPKNVPDRYSLVGDCFLWKLNGCRRSLPRRVATVDGQRPPVDLPMLRLCILGPTTNQTKQTPPKQQPFEGRAHAELAQTLAPCWWLLSELVVDVVGFQGNWETVAEGACSVSLGQQKDRRLGTLTLFWPIQTALST